MSTPKKLPSIKDGPSPKDIAEYLWSCAMSCKQPDGNYKSKEDEWMAAALFGAYDKVNHAIEKGHRGDNT